MPAFARIPAPSEPVSLPALFFRLLSYPASFLASKYANNYLTVSSFLLLPFFGLFYLFQLVENHDCLFDDACAPELALDFDCQNISTGEGIMSWFIGVGALTTLYMSIKYIEDPPSRNPAITRGESDDIVIPLPHHA